MSAIERPTPAQQTRRFLVLGAAAFALIVPLVQSMAGLGLTQSEFAAEGNTTLRVAGYAFSIWSLIYLGLISYAVRQALPQTGESELISALGWPSALALFGIGLWIIVAALNLKVVSVIVIFASLAALLFPLLTQAGTIRRLSVGDRDRWLVAWPLAALAGWLSIAAPLNLITTATALEALPSVLTPSTWAILAVLIVTVTGIAVTWKLRLLAYALPIAWGLIGAFSAEQIRNPALAFTALGAAIVLILTGFVLTFRLKRGMAREL